MNQASQRLDPRFAELDRLIAAEPKETTIRSKRLRRRSLAQSTRRLVRRCETTAKMVAQRYKIDPSNLYFPSRRRPFTWARREFARALRESGWTVEQISRVLHCHHTTVVYYLGTLGSKSGRKTMSIDIPVPDESGVWAI